MIKLRCHLNDDAELELTKGKDYETESIKQQLITVKNDLNQYEKYSRTRFEVLSNE